MREDPTWVYFEPRHATLAPPLNIEHLRYAMGVPGLRSGDPHAGQSSRSIPVRSVPLREVSGVMAVLKNIGSTIGGLLGFGRR